MNRAQQAYRMEQGEFYGEATAGVGDFTVTGSQAALGVIPGGDFYAYANNTAADGDASNALFQAAARDPDNSGARDFSSGVNYNAGVFDTAICVATTKAPTGYTAPRAGTNATVSTAATTLACTGGNAIQ